MKKLIIALPLLAVSLPLTAQEVSPERPDSTASAVDDGSARNTSALADGTPSAPAPKPACPEFRIFWETNIRQGGRNVTMQEVDAPILPKPALVQAYHKRQEYRKKRAEELRLNPPKPEDIEISFWNNDVNQQPASK